MTIIATEPFTLTRDDCRPLYFVAGQEIPVEYENHWFAIAHSEEVEAVAEPAEQPPKPEAQPKKK